MPNPYVLNEGERTKVFCVECAECYYLPVTTEQLTRWKAGELIQKVMPHLARADRELFISGICGTCWTRIVGVSPQGGGVHHTGIPIDSRS